jgi:O-antigen ligase
MMSLTDAVAAATLLALALVAIIVLWTWHDRLQASRCALWIGLLVPMLLTTTTLAAELDAPAVSARDAFRAIIPALAIGVAALLARPLATAVRWPVWFLGAFILWSMATTLWSIAPLATLLKATLLAFQAIALVMLVRRHASVDDGVRAVVAVLHALVLSALIGVVVTPDLALIPAGTAQVNRLWGVFPPMHPNTLGFIAALSVLGVLAKQGPRWATSGAGRVAMAVVSIAVLTGTRTRYALAIAVLVACYALLRRSRTSMAPVGLAAVFVAVAGAAIQLTSGVSQFIIRGQTWQQFTSLTGRTQTWANAMELVVQRPFVGFGYYSGHRVQLSSTLGSANELSNLDNTWIESLVDVGAIGTALLALFVIGAVLVTRRSPMSFGASVFMRIALLSGIIASFVNPSLQTVGYTAIFFGFLLLLGSVQSPPAAAPAGRRSDAAAQRPAGRVLLG